MPEVRRVVLVSYAGSWDAYIDRWKKQHDDLKKAHAGGGAVEIKSRGLLFRGDDLKDYIGLVEERIATLECLKKEYGSEGVALETPSEVPNAASKGAPAAPQGAPKQELAPAASVAAVTGEELNLEVAAICEGKTVAFQITNLGDKWPRLADVSIHRVDTNGKLTQRRLRMANSQQMIFKVPDELAKDAGEIGVFVQPSWYDRKFSYDAKLRCE